MLRSTHTCQVPTKHAGSNTQNKASEHIRLICDPYPPTPAAGGGRSVPPRRRLESQSRYQQTAETRRRLQKQMARRARTPAATQRAATSQRWRPGRRPRSRRCAAAYPPKPQWSGGWWCTIEGFPAIKGSYNGSPQLRSTRKQPHSYWFCSCAFKMTVDSFFHAKCTPPVSFSKPLCESSNFSIAVTTTERCIDRYS